MSTSARVNSSRFNGARSHGPVSAIGKAISSQNGLRHGLRAAPGRVLSGESAAELAALSERWFNKLRLRDETEDDLVNDLVNARWMMERAQRASFAHAKTLIEQVDHGEEKRVAATMRRLLWDRRGHHCMYALTALVDGGPGTSRLDSPDDPNEPSELVRELEACQKGTEALIANWRTLADRVRNDLPLQAHDRLTGIRMLGCQPADCARDDRICLIYIASFALHPAGREDAYEDLKSDMGTIELREFKERVRSRGPLVLDAGNTAKAKEKLLELFDRMLARLSAKLEVHQQHAAENRASRSAQLAVDSAQEAERLRRYEDACQRRVHRCEAAYWKHRREVENAGLGFEDGDDGCDVENATDLATETGADAASGAANKNLTNEPSVGMDASDAEVLQEVASVDKALAQACEELQLMRDSGFEAFMGPVGSEAKGKAAIAASILARGPLLPPVT